MAVAEIIKVADGRSGRKGQKNQRSFSVSYLVRTNDPQDGPIVVFEALPEIGDFYYTDNEYDLGARVADVSVSDEGGDKFLWRAEVRYDRNLRDDPEDQEPENPEEREPKYSIRFEKHEVPISGPYSTADPGHVSATTPLSNSAGQPYNPPITREETRPTIVLLKDERRLDLAGMLALQDTVNRNAFAGFTSQTLKLNVTGVQERFEQGERWWRKTYELAFKREGWVARPLDYGTITDEDGNVRETLLLNSSPTTGAPQYRGPYTIYRQVDFATHEDIPQAVKDLQKAPD